MRDAYGQVLLPLYVYECNVLPGLSYSYLAFWFQSPLHATPNVSSNPRCNDIMSS